MALKNAYSTSSLSNMFNHIEKTLSTHGAKQVVRDYSEGKITALAFVVDTKMGPMAVKLPVKFDRVEKILKDQGIKYKPEQPYRTAWATIRDWVDIQMALLDWEMVKMEEIFLPYAMNHTGETYFEAFEKGKLLLTDSK